VCFKAQFDKIDALVTAAVGEGARVAYGGKAPPPSPQTGGGYFYLPTVLTDVDNASTIARQEVFGPVLAVMTFRDEAEALRLANDSPYGLAAGVWTQNLGRAHRMAASLECGIVWINDHHRIDPASPWGGYKQSGIGSENGVDAYRNYTRLKTVIVRTQETKFDWFDGSGEVKRYS
jgi:acyl-CoA reductase-like NAD-dependent aldehyde dehydrogenase